MSIYINCVCDNQCEKGFQPVDFDGLAETWSDMIECLRSVGWTIELEGAIVKSCICPLCPKGK